MKHIEHIGAFIHTLRQSSSIHALVIQSPPGWAKSATIENTLAGTRTSFESLGSFSTPLYLYNSICDHPNSILVLDDCAGLFEDMTAMSVLKAATWLSVGSNGQRKVSWNSTSGRARIPSTVFSGKFILLINHLPMSREMGAFISRTLYLSLTFQPDEIAEMLIEAAGKTEFYEDTKLAQRVASYLATVVKKENLVNVNLRTLRMCYEVAKAHPDSWESLVALLLPKVSPLDLVRNLSEESTSVEKQVRLFQSSTGLSRRTYFNYRNRIKTASASGPYSETQQLDATCTDVNRDGHNFEQNAAVDSAD